MRAEKHIYAMWRCSNVPTGKLFIVTRLKGANILSALPWRKVQSLRLYSMCQGLVHLFLCQDRRYQQSPSLHHNNYLRHSYPLDRLRQLHRVNQIPVMVSQSSSVARIKLSMTLKNRQVNQLRSRLFLPITILARLKLMSGFLSTQTQLTADMIWHARYSCAFSLCSCFSFLIDTKQTNLYF